MRYRRAISLLLLLCLLAGCGAPAQDTPSAQGSPAAAQEPATVEELLAGLALPAACERELRHAAALGLPITGLADTTLSGVAWMELLDWLVGYAAPDRAAEWEAALLAVRTSQAPLERWDAMAALYLAAEWIGGPYAGHQYHIGEMMQTVAHSWEGIPFTWELFGNLIEAEFDGGDAGPCLLDAACYYFNLARVSPMSGEHPFALDVLTNSFTPSKKPTQTEALLAIARLIASAEPDRFPAEQSAVEAEYLSLADERRAELSALALDLNAETDGTVYYVSRDGSDANSGRTPEKAWATPQHALAQELKPGDAVLLRRGDAWTIAPSDRPGLTSSALIVPEGVTLGAYGEGERPLLSGALEAANDPAFWELHASEGGRKVWKAREKVYYCPVIAFDGGEGYAAPVMPGMDGAAQYLAADGSPFDPAMDLVQDLQFCSLLDTDDPNTNVENAALTGDLYLRCDAGNPAEMYARIDLPQAACGLAMRTESTLAGVALQYFSCNGAVLDGYDGFHSQRVVGAEVGWCGGLIGNYSENHLGVYMPRAAGGALQVSSTGVEVADSHIHHTGPFALIDVIHHNAENPEAAILHFENQRFAGNLIEYCGSGIHMGDYADMDLPGTRGHITNLVFEDNLVFHSGMGWVRDLIWQQQEGGGSSASLSAFETMDSAIDNDGIYIRNNVFYKSAFALFSLSEYHLDRSTRVNALPVFEGNTYVQDANKPLLQLNRGLRIHYPFETAVQGSLEDASGTLIALE